MPVAKKTPRAKPAPHRIVPPHPKTAADADPRVDALVHELIGRVADKWTMIILDVLAEHGELRFSRLGELAGGISQKMLTQTLRGLERDGLISRTVHASVPPRVDYELTPLGRSLLTPITALEQWATVHMNDVLKARRRHDSRV